MKSIPISDTLQGEQVVHLLDEKQEWAIQAALAANRPLLVRGEPGVGKTQLAYAAAELLKRPFVSFVANVNTEAQDLMWTYDAVSRLAEAQVASHITEDMTELKRLIDVKQFVKPGPIWWALHWGSASKRSASGEGIPARPLEWKSTDGVVVLIDEIDKGERHLPNGLLEAFGARQFTPLGWDQPITISEDQSPPLIVITTNNERVLPDAFIRRCFVLEIELPDVLTEEGKSSFVKMMTERGKAHFPHVTFEDADKLMHDAAKLLAGDREAAIKHHAFPIPGQAEYLDFLRAITNLADQGKDPHEVYEQIRQFVFKKSNSQQ